MKEVSSTLLSLCIFLLLMGAIMVAFGGVCGCGDQRERAEKNHVTMMREFVSNVRYFKDKRTGLCFAATGKGNVGGLATVPCDKVEKYLER